MWTLYCLTDSRQGPKPPHASPPAGAGVSHSQAPLHLSRGGVDQHSQLSHASAPIYVMQEKNKWGDAPPFIFVRSVLQSAQDWTPIPGHAVFTQQDAGGRRFTTVPVPVARPADEETDRTSSSLNSAEEAGAKTCEPAVLSVAIPLADVMAARQGSPAGEKHAGINTLAGSDGSTGVLSFCQAPCPEQGPEEVRLVLAWGFAEEMLVFSFYFKKFNLFQSKMRLQDWWINYLLDVADPVPSAAC